VNIQPETGSDRNMTETAIVTENLVKNLKMSPP
jgi:hypothetical protein